MSSRPVLLHPAARQPGWFRAALALALVYAALALAPVFWLALAGWAWSAGVTWLALGLAGCALVALLVPVGCLLRNRFAPRIARPALRRIGAPGEVRQRAA